MTSEEVLQLRVGDKVRRKVGTLAEGEVEAIDQWTVYIRFQSERYCTHVSISHNENYWSTLDRLVTHPCC